MTWPVLPPTDAWTDTRATVHRWTQIVGKVRMAHTPLVNHWWNVPLYVTERGLTTSMIPHEQRPFQIDFDFVDHRLVLSTADGERRSLALEPLSVAAVYEWLLDALRAADVEMEIWPLPVEIPGDVVPFPDDDTGAYDADLGEFVLPYEAVRQAEYPDAALLAFLQTTYEAAAERAGWDRRALERSGLEGWS